MPRELVASELDKLIELSIKGIVIIIRQFIHPLNKHHL